MRGGSAAARLSRAPARRPSATNVVARPPPVRAGERSAGPRPKCGSTAPDDAGSTAGQPHGHDRRKADDRRDGRLAWPGWSPGSRWRGSPGRMATWRPRPWTRRASRRWARICRPRTPIASQPDYDLAKKIGDKAFNQNCARCHGLGAVSGGIAPDLRLLVPVDDDGYFLGRVMSGSIRDGVTYMPPFERGAEPGGDLGDPLLARHGGRAVRLDPPRGACGSGGFGRLAAGRSARGSTRDTVSTVGESLDEIRAKGRLRVGRLRGLRAVLRGTRAAGSPASTVDIARLIADRLGLRLELSRSEAGRDGRGRSAQPCLARHGRRPLGRQPAAARALQPRARDPQRARGAGPALLHREPSSSPAIPSGCDGRAIAGSACRQHDRGRARQPAGLLSRLDAGRPAAGTARPLPPAGGRRWTRCCAGEIAAFMGLRSQIEAGLGQRAGALRSRSIPLPGLPACLLGRRCRRARERARPRLCRRRHPGRRRPRRHHGRASSPPTASATRPPPFA